MRKRMWISVALLLIVPGLILTVSCAKKAAQSEPAAVEATPTPAPQPEATQPEQAAKQEQPEQSAIQAEELKAQQEARAKEAARNLFINEDIYFAFDSAALSEVAQQVLRSKADWLQENPDVTVTIEGHCDERGTAAYNLALGERRAQSAKAFLVNMGIDPARLNTISYGEERPVDPGHNEEAWAKNRRVHFTID